MRLQPPKRIALILAAATVALAGAACAETTRTGVSLQNVDADIVFGVKEVPATAAPANASAPTVAITGLGAPTADVADFAFEDKPQLKRLPPLTTKPVEPCPAAGTNDFAPVEAPLNAVGVPAIGLYRWKYAGQQELTALPGFKLPVNGFEKRLIRNVNQTTPTDFTFDTVQTDLAVNEIVVTTFLVRTAAASQRVSVTDTRAGEPDRGVSIQKIVNYNSKTGEQTGNPFSPIPAVLVLPLPVVPGEQFQSAGVDPTTLTVMQIAGTVTKRQQVDACGSMVDGWQVDMTRTFQTASNSAPQPYQLIIATQLGAIPIAEKVHAQNTQATSDLQFTIGQTKPDPLPQDAPKP